MTNKTGSRMLLQVDYLTGKVYGAENYTGDGRGVDVTVENENFLAEANKRGKDVYFKCGKLEEREKDPMEYYNHRQVLQSEVDRLKMEEQKAFADYTSGRFGKDGKERLIIASARKNEKKKELNKLIAEREQKIKRTVERKLARTDFRYYCSICMIICDDNEYLEEWLSWHILQGIEHFYIYDHASKEPVSKLMQSLPENIREMVTVIRFAGKHDFAQHDAYNHCLKKYKKESRWIGFIDSDEMVRMKENVSLPEWLKKYEGYAGVFIGWIMYNANGQREKGRLPVRQRFKIPSEYNAQKGIGKVFVQPYCMRKMLTHNGYTVEGYEIVDENYDEVEEGVAWKGGLTTDKVCIDHYYTKSYEEWKNKISRGTCDPYYCRKYEEFFKYNPDLEDCREEIFPVQIYEVAVNKKLNKKI